jgi:hypothetical protein
MPAKSLFAIKTETLKENFLRAPRKPQVSTGTLRMSNMNFVFLNLETRRPGIEPMTAKPEHIITKSGSERTIYMGSSKAKMDA